MALIMCSGEPVSGGAFKGDLSLCVAQGWSPSAQNPPVRVWETKYIPPPGWERVDIGWCGAMWRGGAWLSSIELGRSSRWVVEEAGVPCEEQARNSKTPPSYFAKSKDFHKEKRIAEKPCFEKPVNK